MKFKYHVARLQRRRNKHATYIAVTGSAGKTTTTDLTAAILADFGPCRKTHGYNALNSIIGAVWRTRRRHRYCVAELAAGGPGTLTLPARLFKPDIAVITRIGRDHFAAFKSMEALVAEKEKVVRALTPQGTAVLNLDDPLIRAIGERCQRRVLWFGQSAEASLRLIEARSEWPEPLVMRIEYQGRTYEMHTQLHGVHTAIPVLASLGVACAAGLPLEKAMAAAARVQPPAGRMQVVSADDGIVYIRDDLKAPYWSMNAAIEFFKGAKAKRKIAVIGTISDASGDYGPKYRDIASLLRSFADLVVFIGPHARRGPREPQDEKDAVFHGFRDIRNAAEFLGKELRRGDLVLIKGTNEQDHLLRLILNRSRPVLCWEGQCGSQLFCDECPKLYLPRPSARGDTIGDSQAGSRIPLIVGLGNPKARLQNTPHNMGYRVVDSLARTGGGRWMKQAEGSVCDLDWSGVAVRLFKPASKMNDSGAMVRRFVVRTGIRPQNCLVVHDDMNFSFGQVRFRSRGGDAGHKGMRSILAAFDSEDIPRVRLGVRPAEPSGQAKRFVLSKFSAAEEDLLPPMIERAAAMVREFIQKKFAG